MKRRGADGGRSAVNGPRNTCFSPANIFPICHTTLGSCSRTRCRASPALPCSSALPLQLPQRSFGSCEPQSNTPRAWIRRGMRCACTTRSVSRSPLSRSLSGRATKVVLTSAVRFAENVGPRLWWDACSSCVHRGSNEGLQLLRSVCARRSAGWLWTICWSRDYRVTQERPKDRLSAGLE